MSDSRYRARSPSRAAPRGPREGGSGYRSTSDRYPAPSRYSRSPERDRGSKSQHHPDVQYGFPGENNYRPRYSSSPPTQAERVQDIRGSITRNSTGDDVHHDKPPQIGSKEDIPNDSAISNTARHGDTTKMASQEEVSKALVLLMLTFAEGFADGVTNVSGLEIQKIMARREFDRRLAEFNSSIDVHEKFPAIAEAQTRSKARAEMDLKVISEQVDQKKAVLNGFVSQSVAHIMPQMMTSIAYSGQQDPEDRIGKLEKKCEEFQTQLEDSKKEAKDQRRVIENLQKSHHEKDKLFDDKLGGLQKHIKAMESLLQAREDKYTLLQENYSKLSEECGHTKSTLTKTCLPQIASATAKAIKAEVSTRTLLENLNPIKELTARLEAEIPKDLSRRMETLPGLQDQVATLLKLKFDVDLIKQESKKSNTELSKYRTNLDQLGRYYETVNILDRTVNGTGSPYFKGIAASVTDLTHITANDTARSEVPKLAERLEKVECQLLDVTELNSTVSNLKEGLAELDSQLRLVGARKPPTPTTPSLESASLLRLLQLENDTIPELRKLVSGISTSCGTINNTLLTTNNKLDTLEKWKESFVASTEPNSSAAGGAWHPGSDFEAIKAEILEVVEAKQSAVDGVFGQVSAQLHTATEDNRKRLDIVEKNYSDMKSVYGRLTGLSQEIEKVKTSFEQQVKQSLDEAPSKVFDIIRKRPDLLPLGVIESYIAKNSGSRPSQISKESFQDLQDQLEGHAEGLIALDRRVDNINTRNMALFILDQLETLYPNLRTAQDQLRELHEIVASDKALVTSATISLNEIKSQVNGIDTRVSLNISCVNDVKSHVNRIEDRVLKSSSSLSDLRSEVDGMETRFSLSNSYMNDIKGQINDIEFRVSQNSSNLDDLKNLVNGTETRVTQSGSNLNDLKTRVDGIENRISQQSSDEKTIQQLRAEMDVLARSISKVQGTAKAAKKLGNTANEYVAKAKDDNLLLKEEVAAEIGKFEVNLEEARKIVDENSKIRIDLELVKKDLQKIKATAQFASPQRSSSDMAPSRSFSAAVSSSRSGSDHAGWQKPQSSTQGDRSQKKRKLNSSLATVPAGQSLKVPDRALRKKRQRAALGNVDENDSEGSNFEPNQPSISDDEDES